MLVVTLVLSCGHQGDHGDHKEGHHKEHTSKQGGEKKQKRQRVHMQKDSVVFHISHEPKKQDAPFSDVVQVGQFYFLSGQIGMDHSVRELVEGGIEAQTRQTLENIKAVLKLVLLVLLLSTVSLPLSPSTSSSSLLLRCCSCCCFCI